MNTGAVMSILESGSRSPGIMGWVVLFTSQSVERPIARHEQPSDPAQGNPADDEIRKRPPGHVKGDHAAGPIEHADAVAGGREPADSPAPEALIMVFADSEGDPETQPGFHPARRVMFDKTPLTGNLGYGRTPVRPLLGIGEQPPGILSGAVHCHADNDFIPFQMQH